MDSLKSMLEDLRERKGAFFVLIAVAAIVVISILGAISNSQHEFLAKGPGGSQLNTDSNASFVQSASTTDTDTSGQTDGSNSSANTPQTPSVPFSIKTVTLDGTSWKCDSGKVTLLITSARVDAASSVGGTFKWQLEVAGGNIPYSPLNSSVAISSNQISFKLNGGDSGYLYSSADARDGQSVRVHITSPNDVSSTWFTVPAGTVAACANTSTQTTP